MMFLRSLSGQITVVVVAIGAVFGWVASIKSKAVNEERARVEQKSNENAKKADAARRSASKLPADRLRDKFCRDC
jgi:hypothetical protein